jgi:hypothetical protein
MDAATSSNGLDRHSERYLDLSQEDKEKIDSIIAFLSDKTVAEMKSLLSISRVEVDYRATLSHQPGFQGLLNHS